METQRDLNAKRATLVATCDEARENFEAQIEEKRQEVESLNYLQEEGMVLRKGGSSGGVDVESAD